jgi:hypothetical protein
MKKKHNHQTFETTKWKKENPHEPDSSQGIKDLHRFVP